ncbi:TauD/TfdA family dioxygenase [Pendulispora brunnea]|uniref:TauD/TfdA family dioxygenase n=1 Tax=Pendulispora brunnea TaxID=2905690 RepID=A0ABZ2K6N1_9BACT
MNPQTSLGEECVRCDFPTEGRLLPLRIRPSWTSLAREPAAFLDWYRARVPLIESLIADFGAVLFRGFALSDTPDFQRIAGLYQPHAAGYIGGATPRKVIDGQVYESTRMPAPFKIGLHQEKAYMAHYPRLLAFYCKHAAEAGGETPLCDMREVTRKLDARVVERFRAKGVMYRRNFFGPKDREASPAAAPSREYHRPWSDAFSTDDPARVEEACRERGLSFEWLRDGSVTVSHVGGAMVRHRRTGTQVWFNQAAAQHVNPRAVGDFSFRYLQRKYQERAAFPYDVRFGDGEPMSMEDLAPVYDAMDAHETAFAWESGDLLLIDNILVAHGRNPFRGKRDVQVAMMD